MARSLLLLLFMAASTLAIDVEKRSRNPMMGGEELAPGGDMFGGAETQPGGGGGGAGAMAPYGGHEGAYEHPQGGAETAYPQQGVAQPEDPFGVHHQPQPGAGLGLEGLGAESQAQDPYQADWGDAPLEESPEQEMDPDETQEQEEGDIPEQNIDDGGPDDPDVEGPQGFGNVMGWQPHAQQAQLQAQAQAQAQAQVPTAAAAAATATAPTGPRTAPPRTSASAPAPAQSTTVGTAAATGQTATGFVPSKPGQPRSFVAKYPACRVDRIGSASKLQRVTQCKERGRPKQSNVAKNCMYRNMCAEVTKLALYGTGNNCVPTATPQGGSRGYRNLGALRFPMPADYKNAINQLKTQHPGYVNYMVFIRKYGLLCGLYGAETFCSYGNSGDTCELGCGPGGPTPIGTWYIGDPSDKSVRRMSAKGNNPEYARFRLFQIRSNTQVGHCGILLHRGWYRVSKVALSTGCMTMPRAHAKVWFGKLLAGKRTHVTITGNKATYGVMRVIGAREDCGVQQAYQCT